MPTKTRRLKEIVKRTANKNSCHISDQPWGINIDKTFMPSVANINGVDLSKYKIVEKNQFACNRMHVGRDGRLPIALNTGDPIIVSPAYDVFEIRNSNEIMPEYMMLFFRTAFFDKECWFYTDADVRGALVGDSFYDIKVPVPDLDEQRKLVNISRKINNSINKNNLIIERLEKLLKHSFYDNTNSLSSKTTLDAYCSITSGKTQNDKRKSPDNDYATPIAGASGIIGYSKKSNYEAPFLTVGRVGTFGAVNIYFEDAWAADNVLVVQTDYVEFVNQILRKIDYSQLQKGGVQGLITQTDLKQVAVPSLDDKTILEFEKKATKIRTFIRLLEHENATMNTLIEALSSSINNKKMEVS